MAGRKMPERVDNAANRVFAKGEKIESSQVTIDPDIDVATVTVDRALLANISSDVCFVRLMVSEDKGVTWKKWGGMSLAGGELRGRAGHVIPYSYFTVDLPPKSATRMCKVEIDAKARSRLRVDIDQLIGKTPVNVSVEKRSR